MSKTVLVATEKPFSKDAVSGIQEILGQAAYRVEMLENYTQAAELIRAVASVDALIVRSDLVTPEVLAAAPRLRLVVRAGAGFDNIDLKAASARDVVVMNTPGQNANAVAELVFGLMLQLARRGYSGKAGTELRGKRIGLHAYGAVGRGVAAIASGFGMEVVAYDPFVRPEAIQADAVTPVTTPADLYTGSDYISLHLPKTKETVGSINWDLLSRLNPGAALINTARTEVVDEPSLLRMFAERPGFRYGTDVPPQCKPDIEAAYADRFFCTQKKMGAQTAEANYNAGLAAARQIVGFFERGDTTFRVN